MHDIGCLGLVHWDDPEGWYREGGWRRVQDGWKRKNYGDSKEMSAYQELGGERDEQAEHRALSAVQPLCETVTVETS